MLYTPEQRKSDQARRLELHQLQSELLIMQQDNRKKKRKLEAVVLEIKRLRNEERHIRLDLKARTDEEGKLKRETGFLDVDIKRIQKKINMMS